MTITRKTVTSILTTIIFTPGSYAQIPRGDAPPNDECTGAAAQFLNVGDTLVFAGDNTGANQLEGTPFVVVWEAFTLEDCATVHIDHCTPGFVYAAFINTITNTCPEVENGQVTAAVIEECSMTYHDLGPGTWYIPVLVDPDLTPVGDYSFSITALECNSPYCSAEGGAPEHTGSITGVQLGTLDFSQPPGDLGYIDNTTEIAYVGTGQDHEITIILDTMDLEGAISDTAQLLVWIDLDQNGDFNDPGELVFISEDPYEGIVHTGNVSIPATAALGTTRMRIRLHDRHDGSDYENLPNNTPCDNSAFGQVIDLSVGIDLGTAIGNGTILDWDLYPNPSDGEIHLVTYQLSGPVTIEILDLSGRMIMQLQEMLQPGAPIHLSFAGKLRPGGYLLQFTNGNERHSRPFFLK